jgi:UDP-N-acetylglucosamine transferase subunit ALG13
LSIQSGWGSFNKFGRWRLAVGGWVNRKMLKWNYGFIGKFSECWVPDFENNLSFAGRLSHPPLPPPVPLKYIGILSRFKSLKITGKKNPLLIILSGPEPQRNGFEIFLFSQLAASTLKAIVVRGLPGEDSIPFIREGIKIFNHLPTEELNVLMIESEMIITRSGYSTIMDLVQVKKSAILVPTPGQTEQEYLGLYMQDKKWMYCVSQKNFDLEKALAAFQKKEFILPVMPASPLQYVVEDFLKTISQETKTIEDFL